MREALTTELPRVTRFYADTQYAGGLSPSDRVIVAEQEGELLGAYRLARENGVLVLRGMRVAPSWQRRGIGTQMLRPLLALRERCFCIPYSRLMAFYAQVGFLTLPTSDGPALLVERLASYRARGLDVCLLLREPILQGRLAA